jgi:hypothetical protein
VERSGTYRVLVSGFEGRTKFGRPRNRWVDYIKMDLQEVGWRNISRIDLAKNRERWWGLVNAVMKPSGSLKCGEFLD